MFKSLPPSMRRKAFTLIELLVVIAIIAILAAILFPVFAQAKAAAKKTVSLSNTKQTATAFNIYSSDTDDTLPLAYPFDSNGTMLTGGWSDPGYFNALVPADAKVWDLAPLEYIEDSRTAWNNSIQPYMKSIEMMDTPLSIPYSDSFYQGLTSRPLSSLPRTHMTMNGLLNGYSASAVANPSGLPLATFSNGKESYNGRQYTNPYMACRAIGTPGNPAPPCVFNPSGMPQAGVEYRSRADTYEFSYVATNDTTWTHGEGTIAAFTDSSAKFIKTPKKGLNTSNHVGPAYEYSDMNGDVNVGGGYVYDPARCVTGDSAPAYLSWFRPDNTGNYQLGDSGMRVSCNN
ncbi:hypothetical protein BH11ARM2_BH11ARM2_37390 [soil metagenome]